MTSKFAKIAAMALFLAAAGTVCASNEALFPKPKALERDVNFWVSIFTEYTTSEGVLHDSRDLAVVYEKIDLPKNASRRTRNRLSRVRTTTLQFKSLQRMLSLIIIVVLHGTKKKIPKEHSPTTTKQFDSIQI